MSDKNIKRFRRFMAASPGEHYQCFAETLDFLVSCTICSKTFVYWNKKTLDQHLLTAFHRQMAVLAAQ
jgi:hypothetical protein